MELDLFDDPSAPPDVLSSLRLPTPAHITLADAQDNLLAVIQDGAECPCCGQFAKVYKRKFNSGIAKALIDLYRETEGGHKWFHARNVLVGIGSSSAEYSKPEYWGLMERKKEKKEDGNISGFYKLTDAGRDFILGRRRVEKFVHLYNTLVYGFSGPEITIREAIGDHFNYDELMAGRG